MTAQTSTAQSSKANSNSLRTRLLIGASIGAMLLTGVAEAQDRSGGGRVFSGRGGGDPTAAAARAAQDQATRANETNSATQRAITAFRRAAETRQAMNDAQAAARALARATHVTVPNGMGPGGLQVANGVGLDPSLWVGANRPVQSEGENGRTNVSIEQTQQQAILNWDSFNVGRETDLSFNQGGADWVALNRVVGNSADPSQILGSIKAQGTVLILNQNGVIFGGASQVNVRNLIASSASISNEQFLNRGIYSPLSGSDYLAAFTNARGAVTVEAGAQIITNTPASVTSGGGYVLLMGTEVRNDGTIITPRGQTVLSAGDDFIIRRGYGTEENPYSTTRGNEVRGLIGEGSTSGTVINAGLIEAAQGDITLAGRTIRQDGVALATTSVNQRGTIHLLNSASDGQGLVTLGKDSLTVVLPELESEDTALNSQRDALIAQSDTANLNRHTTTGGGFDDRSLLADRLDQSRIEIVTGGNVTFEGGSQTMAQGGQVAVQAGAGRITVEDGARIDVSGVMGVALNMADNSIQVNIQGNELRDSPANRDSDNLKNQNVWIDVRDLILLPDGTGGYDGDRWYTPGGLLEVGGHLANMSHGIGEWAAVGGTITLSASEIVAQQGAVFDLSGGSLDYRSGYVRSTRVMGADGRMYDIRNAPAHLQIVAVGNSFIRRHDRWGDMYMEVYSDPLFSRGTSQRWEDGYTVGRDAGRLILSAPTVVFDGDIVSEVINGERQVNTRANGVTDGYKLGQHTVARGGALTVANVNAMGFDTPHSSRLVIGDVDAAGMETGEPVPAERQGSVLLDADRLNGYGLGEITLVTDGGIAIEGGVTLADGGELNLVSGNIAIDADVTIRSGTLTATNRATIDGVSGTGDAILLGDGNPAFRLGDGATIDLSGIWSNARIASEKPLALAHVDGGSLSVRMVEGSVRLEAGSTVDLSSGAALLDIGSLMGGRGGDLTLIANEDRSAVPGGVDIDRTGKELLLDGVIRAQGVVGGGTLTLQSPSPVLFGENALLESGVLGAGVELPADVILSEAINIVAGARLPVGMTTRLSSLPPGVPSQGHSSFEPVMAADDWTVPAEFSNGVYFDGGFAMPGDVIPAGSMVSLYTIPQGVVLPAAVFPDGIPVAPFDLALAAGDIAPIELVIPAGKVLARGTVFDQDILFGAASPFDASLLQSGFSQYDITSRAGLVVAPGTDLTVETPVLRTRDAAFTAATGTRPQDILESWMPPQFLENPETGHLTPRAGANLSFHGASLEIARGARIAVDPGHSVDLVSTRQMIVDGAIIAPGGDISLRSEPLPTETSNLSIWIGENATLDAAGRSWTARDARGLRYGIAQNGGSIRIGLPNYDRVAEDLLNASRAAVIIREGAVLDASGASATIDIGMGPLDAARTVQLVGNGGLIQIGSMVGIVNDGTMRAAAGGTGAAGGRLNLVLENQLVAPRAVRTLTVSQDRVASGLSSETRPGDRLADGLLGTARISVEEIEAGGFGSLDVWSRDVIEFSGDVDLSLGQSLALRRGMLSVASETPDARVVLSAPHVLLSGKVPQIGGPGEDAPGALPAGLIGGGAFGSGYTGYSPSSRNEGQLRIEGSLIDVTDSVFFGGSGIAHLPGADGVVAPVEIDRFGFDHVDLVASGDLRFTDGLLWTAGDMTLTAAQIYPTTHARGEALAGVVGPNQFHPDRWLKIRGNGATPSMPYSVFGELYLRASKIDQGGIVRAPLGRIVLGPTPNMNFNSDALHEVVLRAGSLTSTSAGGLLIPYGGTADGLKYFYNGEEVTFRDLADLGYAEVEIGVQVGQAKLTAEDGSVIDLSGGGELTGAGFFTGRGGSLDVLRTALANVNPGYGFSSPDAEVYAIVPSMGGGYAPISPDAGAGAPRVGQQITIPEGVDGLPAGTYTLMPSTYALLPGAFRVELGGASPRTLSPQTLPPGMVLASGYLGVANTAIRDGLPTRIALTPAEVVRSYSQYNETGYSAFAVANAARFNGPAPRLERDAQSLHLDFGAWQGDVLNLSGEVRMAGAKDGAAGNLFLTANGPLEIKTQNAQATEGYASVDSEDLARVDAGILTVGGLFDLTQARAAPELGAYELGPRVVFEAGDGEVVVRDGASLRAGQVFLVSQDRVAVEGGAVIEAEATDSRAIDFEHGYIFSDTQNLRNASGGAILGVSGGDIRFTAPTAPYDDGSGLRLNRIDIADGAMLRTPGSLSFSTNGVLNIGEAELNARYVTLTSPSIHVGTAESFARADEAGILGTGVRLSQSMLERLVRPSTAGQQALERLTLNAGGSINLLGEVTLDLRQAAGGADTMLLLETPALYGWGEAGETARIIADTVVWSGLSAGAGAADRPFVSLPPAPVADGGPGTGSGTLTIDARRIELGYAPYAQPQDQVALDRLALGFATVNLLASERITANHRGTLSVYARGTDAVSYAGGDLNLVTPVLTGTSGSFVEYRAGGDVRLTAPEGAAAPDLSTFRDLGAEVRLAGGTVTVDTAVALPSGRLVLEAEDGIRLTDRAAIDLSGRTITMFDVTRHSWGGDLVMETRDGTIVQDEGSMIDVSATGHDAGLIAATATGADGAVILAGGMRGAGAGGFASGSVDIRARSLADFANLNESLNAGGFFEARTFVIRSGDLTIGDEVRARRVSISADDGSLTVNGRIDASGAKPGEIRLAARDDLVLAAGAHLDVSSSELQRDGRGDVIEASNRGRVELTSAAGRVSLRDGSVIDLRSADGVSRGRVEINAQRLGASDVAIDAGGQLTIQGAQSIAVNAFRTYAPDDGRINQGYLDAIHGDSAAFIDAALGNDALTGRLAGLASYGDAFHLRPGVEIRSAIPDGNLIVDGDLDLSGYRYGPDADPSARGSGEAGVLTIRAGGDLNIKGSISDGFAPPPDTPDDPFFTLIPGETVEYPAGTTRPEDWWLDADLTLQEDWTVPDTPFYQNFMGSVYDTNWNYYGPGQTIPAGTTLAAYNTAFEANTPLPSYTGSTPDTYQAGRVWAAASMLAPGSQSWSMRLVSGADLTSADTRTLIAASRLGDQGDMILNNPGLIGPQRTISAISVIRTGTGDLELLSGGDHVQKSLFGIYTAGAQIADGGAWDVGRAVQWDGSVLGGGNEAYEATLDPRRMYLTTGGGDLRLTAQGDIRGYTEATFGSSNADIGEWLWRQGGAGLDQPTAWGVNFGQYRFDPNTFALDFVGFSGVGTLGGGNVTVTAGGDIGSTTNVSGQEFVDVVTDGLAVVVGSSGRIDTSGRLVQSGGGDLVMVAGGRINTGLNERPEPDSRATIVNLRGSVAVRAGAIGQTTATGYGVGRLGDPRAVDITAPSNLIGYSPLVISLGDAQARFTARGSLVIASGKDPGRAPLAGGQTIAGGDGATGTTAFSLWTDRSGMDLVSAGGDIVWSSWLTSDSYAPTYSPGRFTALAAGGSIMIRDALVLAPSRQSALELLARDHLLGNATRGNQVGMSGATPDRIATPFNPLWISDGPSGRTSNAFTDYGHLEGSGLYDGVVGSVLFAFGPNTAGALAQDSLDPIRLYALNGDIGLRSGLTYNSSDGTETYWVMSRPTHIRAGRDIVAGSHLMLNRDEKDISVVRAGRDILNSSFRVGGPGLLDVAAGRNIYQAYTHGGAIFPDQRDQNLGVFQSLGPLIAGDTRPGAGIFLSAGLGAEGADLGAFAARYLDPTNLADPDRPLADQPGKAVRTYERELLEWLRSRHGYDGGADGARASFDGLSAEERGLFLRSVYFEELRLAGREYNDPESGRFGSYLRGREAIATFLPGMGEGDEPGDYFGSITFLEGAGVHTYAGGDVQILAPGGGLTLGADGIAPPVTTGLLTQGQGDIEVFTRESVLLGLSRVFTTFGGGITMWSAEGDINAGRGAKTTLVYTPPRRVYDDYGNVVLSPQTPTSGAGIATLNPIPEVPAGDIDLIAPLGTIDAGEAGIRVSGNINLAALQVINAANIQVQGDAAGIPMAAVVNTGALTAASSASTAVANQAAELAERARPEPIRDLPSIITGRLLGFGE